MTSTTARLERANYTASAWTLERVGEALIRYGLVATLLWIGPLKFTAYGAESIKDLVTNSPFLSWGYGALGMRGFASLIGLIEIGCGVLIATRPVAPKLSAIGSYGVIVMALLTLSFLFTTPGVWQPGYGFPFPSPMPGQFLLKDILLLGAAVWTGGEAQRAARAQPHRADHGASGR